MNPVVFIRPRRRNTGAPVQLVFLAVMTTIAAGLASCSGGPPPAGVAGVAGTAPATAAGAAFDGIWQGTLPSGAQPLAISVTINAGQAWLDVPAQGLKAFPASSVSGTDQTISVEFRQFGASLSARPDGAGGLAATWRQGGSLEFSLRRPPADRPAAPDQSSVPPEASGALSLPPEAGQPVRFTSAGQDATGQAITLAGTLRLPGQAAGTAMPPSSAIPAAAGTTTSAAGTTTPAADSTSPAADPWPAVILISGSGPQNRDEELFGLKPFRDIAEALAARGWASLRYDDRGVGQSGGRFAGATSADFADDAVGAWRLLAADPRIDSSRIVLMGHSEGATVACLAENRLNAGRPGSVQAVVLLAGPGQPGRALLLEQSADLMAAIGLPAAAIAAAAQANAEIYDLILGQPEFPALAVEAILAKAGLSAEQRAPQLAALSDPWYKAFLAYDPQEALSRLGCPVLALNGSLDLQVRADRNLAAIAAGAAKAGVPATTRRLDGLNHLFQRASTGLPAEYAGLGPGFSSEVMAIIADWLDSL